VGVDRGVLGHSDPRSSFQGKPSAESCVPESFVIRLENPITCPFGAPPDQRGDSPLHPSELSCLTT